MGEASFFLMEFSVLVMISVAVLLAHGDSSLREIDGRNQPTIADHHEFVNKEENASSSGTAPPETVLLESNAKNLSKRMSASYPSAEDISFEEYEDNFLDSNVEKRKNDKKQYSRKFKYDPALKFMGLGKRFQYDPALKYMGLGKRVPQYDPALKYMGFGKRAPQYDPALKYMGLGKRVPQYDPALRYMGLGKRPSLYDPALKYMGLGKRAPQYDPALKYMGLGKRAPQYDPALKYMGLGKRAAQYDPALKYMGLGKRAPQYDPALKYMGLGKRAPQYDPALKYMGLGKRAPQYDPALKYMGLGKRAPQYDPALKYMGLGKRVPEFDPTLKYMSLGKRKFQYDPALKYMGLGKRDIDSHLKSQFDDNLPEKDIFTSDSSVDVVSTNSDDEPLPFSDLYKRGDKYDPALRYMGLGKRKFQYDPAMKYMGLGKRGTEDNPATFHSEAGSKAVESKDNVKENGQGSRLKKRSFGYGGNSNYKNGKKGYVDDSLDKVSGLGKRPYKFDPALRFMGLGKRMETVNDNPQLGKRPSKFDPALKYMGIGKRGQYSNQGADMGFLPYFPGILDEDEDEDEDEDDYNDDDETEEDVIAALKNKLDNKKHSIYLLEESEKHMNDKDSSKIPYDPHVMFMGLDKRNGKYDPALMYMGLGKRGLVYDPRLYYGSVKDGNNKYDNARKYINLGNPEIALGNGKKISVDILEFARHSNESKNCRDRCLRRRKRNASSGEIDMDSSDEDEKAIEGEISTENSWNRNVETEAIHQRKRDRDNRPKYNPGWIFIGLGKRGEPSDDTTFKDKAKAQNLKKSGYEILFEDYYGMLEKMKDKIQDIKFRLGDGIGWYSQAPQKIKQKISYKLPYGIKEDEIIWSEPTTPRVVLSDGIPPNTWLDFVPTITKIGK